MMQLHTLDHHPVTELPEYVPRVSYDEVEKVVTLTFSQSVWFTIDSKAAAKELLDWIGAAVLLFERATP